MSIDKLIKVQNAAKEALRVWTQLKAKLQTLEMEKMTRDVIENNPDEIIKYRTGIDIHQSDDIGKILENASAAMPESIVIYIHLLLSQQKIGGGTRGK